MSPNEKLFNILMKGDISSKLTAIFNLAETEEQYIQILQKYPKAIEKITNQTEELQLVAVKTDPEALFKISNPTNNVILEALSKRGNLIFSFKSLIEKTEEMWLVALKQDIEIINKIKDPTINMMLTVVEIEPWYIRNFSKSTPIEVQKRAVLSYISKKSDLSYIHEVLNYCPDIKEFSQEVCDHISIKDIIE